MATWTPKTLGERLEEEQSMTRSARRYVLCSDCERSFHTGELNSGKLPAHTFCGKPCKNVEPTQ
jgi:hypothetical protein